VPFSAKRLPPTGSVEITVKISLIEVASVFSVCDLPLGKNERQTTTEYVQTAQTVQSKSG
jgi:hypothetical protein